MVQWLNSELPMHRAQVQSLVGEPDPTCCNSEFPVPQLKKAPAPQLKIPCAATRPGTAKDMNK